MASVMRFLSNELLVPLIHPEMASDLDNDRHAAFSQSVVQRSLAGAGSEETPDADRPLVDAVVRK